MNHDRDSLARARALLDAAMTDPRRWSGNLAQAESLLAAAAASAPDAVALLTCLGAVRCDLGNHGDAVEVLQRAVRLRSGDRNTYFNLGVALLASGKRRQAMGCFRKAAPLQASAATWEAYFDPQAQ